MILLVSLLGCTSGAAAPNRVRGVGTLEVVEVDVGPSVPARVERVWVEEGEAVRAGDTLVSLTQPTLAADIEGRRARLAATEAEVRAASAALAERNAQRRDLVLVSPVAGVVFGRHAEPGEMLGAGEAAVTVGQVARPWTRIYVDQRALPLVHVGQRATAVLDAFPDRRFEGRVAAINDHAEFTPRVALTEEERADLLFGVKVEFADTTGMLKSGLPVTVTIEPTLVAAPPAGREGRGGSARAGGARVPPAEDR